MTCLAAGGVGAIGAPQPWKMLQGLLLAAATVKLLGGSILTGLQVLQVLL